MAAWFPVVEASEKFGSESPNLLVAAASVHANAIKEGMKEGMQLHKEGMETLSNGIKEGMKEGMQTISNGITYAAVLLGGLMLIGTMIGPYFHSK